MVLAARVRREGWAFILMGVAIVGAVALIFGGLYPNVMPAIDGVNNLTVADASSSQYTLGVMTWVAVALTPIVLAYQAWTYWVFRKRIHVDQIPESTGLLAREGVKPLDPRLLQRAASARRYVLLTAGLGGLTAAAVIAQALLLARVAVPRRAADGRLAGRRSAGGLARGASSPSVPR